MTMTEAIEIVSNRSSENIAAKTSAARAT